MPTFLKILNWDIFAYFFPIFLESKNYWKHAWWRRGLLTTINQFMYLSFTYMEVHMELIHFQIVKSQRSQKYLKDSIFYNTSLLWKKYQIKISQFLIFFSMLQVNAITFWDLTTWKCVISMYTCIYVKLRYIAAQEVPLLEFHMSNFLWQTHLFTFSN